MNLIVSTILIYFLIASLIVQLFYYLYFFSRIIFYRDNVDTNKERPFISVVICAKNEEKNVKENLPSILNQHYSNFEVIVVNDGSTDNTWQILEIMAKNFSHLKITSLHPVNKKFTGKKEALTKGIEMASYEIIVVTDADCTAASKNWLNKIAKQYHANEKVEVILGYGPYIEEKGWLNKFIRYETLITAVQYFSYAIAGLPYMGVGRNLSYKKECFQKTGINKHMHITSGDDDLLIKDIAHKSNTSILLDQESFVYSKGASTFRNWTKQKLRHYSTGKYYHPLIKLLLGLFIASKLIFYAALLGLTFLNDFGKIILVTYAFYTVVTMLVMRPISQKLKVENIWFFIPLLDLMFIIINFSYGLAATYKHETQWK